MAMLQVRNVPDDVYETLKERARAQGVSVSEYVREVLARDTRFAPLDRFLADVRKGPPPPPSVAGEIEQALRDVRDKGE